MFTFRKKGIVEGLKVKGVQSQGLGSRIISREGSEVQKQSSLQKIRLALGTGRSSTEVKSCGLSRYISMRPSFEFALSRIVRMLSEPNLQPPCDAVTGSTTVTQARPTMPHPKP